MCGQCCENAAGAAVRDGSVEEALEVPRAAELIEEDHAQQARARDDLVIRAIDRLAPPAVVDAPSVADAHLAVIGPVEAQPQGLAGRIGLDLDQRMVEVQPGHARYGPISTSRARSSGSAAVGRSTPARHSRPGPKRCPMRSSDQRSSSHRPARASKAGSWRTAGSL